MAASTEVRTPFVDVEVVQGGVLDPGQREDRRPAGKIALKKAAEHPARSEIVHRPKGLFSAPLRAWMSRDLAPLVRRGRQRRRARPVGFPAAEALQRWSPRTPPASRTVQAPLARLDSRVLVPERDDL
jgi:asparagine synthase (glutamine-hydrolysing)